MNLKKWKIPFVSRLLSELNFDKKIPINISNPYYRIFLSRNNIISNIFMNKRIKVYNGKRNVSIRLVNSMIGHKLGEFSITKLTGRAIYI